MSSRITKFKLSSAGVRSLLKSAEAQALVKSYADEIVQTLGDGYEVTTRKGKFRANAEIRAVTRKARRDNLQNNTILKAVFGK